MLSRAASYGSVQATNMRRRSARTSRGAPSRRRVHRCASRCRRGYSLRRAGDREGASLHVTLAVGKKAPCRYRSPFTSVACRPSSPPPPATARRTRGAGGRTPPADGGGSGRGAGDLVMSHLARLGPFHRARRRLRRRPLRGLRRLPRGPARGTLRLCQGSALRAQRLRRRRRRARRRAAAPAPRPRRRALLVPAVAVGYAADRLASRRRDAAVRKVCGRAVG